MSEINWQYAKKGYDIIRQTSTLLRQEELYMFNYIWAGMILFAFVVALFTGRIEQTTQAALDSAGGAVQLAIGLLGIMCLWTGLMKIAEKSGLIHKIARLIRPITNMLFPQISPQSPAMGAMVLNMIANLMGLANAATPLGLKAMNELQKINHKSDTASHAMCMFVVVNTASAQLIPTTVIAIRSSMGSQHPFEIIFPVWICSFCALCVGVIMAKLFAKKEEVKALWRS